jgi:uncharacterized protein (DUF302 family)
MSANGLMMLRSAHDAATTVERLTKALESRGITVFAQIDHAAGAAGAGLALRPTTLVIFGNPAAGTPLMQAAQTAGIDLPLKTLIWEDADGATHLTYNDPAWIAERHGLGSDVAKVVSALTTVLATLAVRATSA